MSIVPRITTPRLVLRGFRAEEFDAFAEELAIPEANKFTAGVADRRAAWRAFSGSQGMWMLHGAGWWAAALLESDEVVGSVGVFRRETSPELEIGWRIYQRHWGKGYATEAASAALAFGFATFTDRHVVAYIDHGNEPSERVSRRLGMAYERDAELYGTVVGRYVVARP